MTNTEEREQLAKLEGAQSAMIVALTRIDRLETMLIDQMTFSENLRKTLGTELYANFYQSGGHKVIPIHIALDQQISKIKNQIE